MIKGHGKSLLMLRRKLWKKSKDNIEKLAEYDAQFVKKFLVLLNKD